MLAQHYVRFIFIIIFSGSFWFFGDAYLVDM